MLFKKTNKLTDQSVLAILLAATLFLFGSLSFVQVAQAESPIGCNSVNLQQSPLVSPAGLVYDGDTLTYSVTYTNLDPDGGGPSLPCDITSADATITLPDTSVINVLIDVDLPLGTTISCPGDVGCAAGPYEYVVDHSDESGGVVTADFDISGLREGITQTVAADDDSIPTTVLHPSTDVSADLDLNTVIEGNDVTLTITEENDGDAPLINVYVEVSPLALVLDENSSEFSGTDAGGDGILSPGETWEWTVVDTPAVDTTYTVVGHGETALGDDVTWTEGCEQQDPEDNVICDADEIASDSVRIVQGLEVEKTVNESFDRDWDWEIEKVGYDEDGEVTELILAEGETYTVDYEVTVTPSSEDINHEVTGTITVTNPSGNPLATITGITDVLDESGAATVDCTSDGSFSGFPHDLAAGESLVCDYEQLSADPDDSENVATVSTSGDVPGGSDTQPVNFEEGDLDEVTDECVLVSDDNENGPQNEEICADDSDMTLEYSVTFGPEGGDGVDVPVECGMINWPNIADFLTNDNAETDTSEWDIDITVNCVQGCTLTQGYWKTHSESGPAPYDDNWQNIFGTIYDDGDGDNEEENEEFYKSAQTWYEVFWTPPKGGNAYYQLAHQYMAAVLNTLNLASAPSEVEDAIAESHTLFETFAPDELVGYAVNKKGKTTGKKTILEPEAWDDMKEYASLLASYNEGDIGPGHCDEQVPEGTI